MSDRDNRLAPRPVFRPRWLRIRLSTALGLVVVVALILAVWTHTRQASVPWQRYGGMIGWSQARIVAQLGQPARMIESDLADPVALSIGPAHHAALSVRSSSKPSTARLSPGSPASAGNTPASDPSGSKETRTTDTVLRSRPSATLRASVLYLLWPLFTTRERFDRCRANSFKASNSCGWVNWSMRMATTSRNGFTRISFTSPWLAFLTALA